MLATTWRMHMTTPEANTGVDLALTLPDGRRDDLSLVGPSSWGNVFRSTSQPSLYRLVSLADAPLELRQRCRDLAHRPRQRSIAPVVEVEQANIEGRHTFILRYELDPDCSLVDVLVHKDLEARLAYAERTFRSLPLWRDKLHLGLLPMPADIMFVGVTPYYLPIPEGAHPSMADLWEIPERCWYLAPQLVRGLDALSWKAHADVYAFGAIVLQCFFELCAIESAPEALTLAATGALHSPDRLSSRLPFWLDQLGACENALDVLRRAVHPSPEVRSAVDPTALADELAKCRQGVDPGAAVAKLRLQDRPVEALAVLDDILLEQPGYELFILAGDVAFHDMREPLQAIDRYERAIKHSPGKSDAYERQFDAALIMIELGLEPPAQLDKMMQRNYDGAPFDETRELNMARYFLWRNAYQQAEAFVYPRLFEGGQYAWWKFDLALSYAAAKLGSARLDEAEPLLADIKSRLLAATHIPPEEKYAHGSRLSELEVTLHELRQHSRNQTR